MAQPLKILIIDDSPSIRTIIRLYLMGRQLEFIEATDGAHGLQLAVERGVDLVIADFNMPVMNGIDFVSNLRIHENEALRGVPVILLTANKDEEVKNRALEAGVNAFAVKPISRDQLTSTVEQHLPKEGSRE
ncbi:MAG TPA: response regulator [Myxococcales bacterium]|nr:response regulator [Myxococcales bacterium]